MTSPARRLAVLLVGAGLLASALAGCSAGGQGATAPRPTDRTDEPSTSGAPPTSSGSASDEPDDVVDAVFPGHGDPRIDVSDYAVRVKADPGRPELEGRVEMVLQATTDDPLRSFTLDLRGPKVTAATVDGETARVRADEAEITVTPASPLRPDTDATVVLRYAGRPDTPRFPRLGVEVGWQEDADGGWFTMSEPNGTSTWVPVNDHPSDKATWTITLDTPAAATGVASGRFESSTRSGPRTTWRWRTRQPMAPYLAFAAVGAYDLVPAQGRNGVQVMFAFPPSLSKERRAGFAELADVLEFFGQTFGRYPFDAAGAVVVTSTLGLALETQTRPLFGSDAVGKGVVWALPHELAHQWFGDAISPARWEDLWLNESFATYADWLYTAHRDEVPITEVMDDQPVPTRGNLAVTDPEAAATFDGVIYQGGARALHALRLTIGDDDFFALLRRWFAENSGSTVTTEDFEALAAEVSGQDLDAFFDAWLHAPDQPDLPD